jgi:hypothetical protein
MADTLITKYCHHCNEVKKISEFYKNKSKPDGCQNQCKSCQINYRRSDFGRKYQSKYAKSEAGKQSKEKSKQRKEYKIKIIQYRKDYRIRFPEKVKARDTLNHSVDRGEIKLPTDYKCSHCEKQAIEYHHPDYSKPLFVVPLCKNCHEHLHTIAYFVMQSTTSF